VFAQLPWGAIAEVFANSPTFGPTVSPSIWNLLYAWLPGVDRVSRPTALLLYPTMLYLATGAVGAGIGGVSWRRRRRARRTNLSDVVDPPEPEHRRPASRRPHGRTSHRPEWKRTTQSEPDSTSADSPEPDQKNGESTRPPTDQRPSFNGSVSDTSTSAGSRPSPPATSDSKAESEAEPVSESEADAGASGAESTSHVDNDDRPATTPTADEVEDEPQRKRDRERRSDPRNKSESASEDNSEDEDAESTETAAPTAETTGSTASPEPSPSAASDTKADSEGDTGARGDDEAPHDGGFLARIRRMLPTPGSSAESKSESESESESELELEDTESKALDSGGPSGRSSPTDAEGQERDERDPPGDTPPEAIGKPPTSADAIAEAHQRLAAADEIEWGVRESKVGEQYAKGLYVAEFPDYPKDGFLHELFEVTDAEFDATFHFKPRNQNRTRERLKRRADDLKAEAKQNDGTGSEYLAAEGVKMEAAHDAMERGVRAFTTSAYVTVRGDTAGELRASEASLRRVLTDDSQADLDVQTTQGKQDVLLQAASPLGPDVARRQSPSRYSHIQLSGGIGAVLSSFQNPSIMEEGGIELGRHKDLKTPIVVDPFKRENGYSKLKIADQGGGKSHSSKMEYIRMISQRDDCIGIVLEPMGNWTGVSEATDAEHIVIGGSKQINPLKIQAIGESARRRIKTGETPLKNKKDGALGWLRNYFELRGLGDQLSDRIVTLENAVEDAYHDCGFREGDYDTFDNDSPTIRDDLIPQLRAREDAPEDYAKTTQEASTIREDAEWLRRNLRPFVDGRFAALGGEGDVDLTTSENIYLDLGQEEGREISDQAALTMQLLIDLVYQRATRTPKKVVFPIDEFHYITSSAVNLGFLETLLRHHRHHKISPWFITQTVDEFLDNEIADRILKLTTMTQFHHIDTFGEEQAEPFDLSPTMQQFVRNAAPGSPKLGYSDSLIGIDGEWRRMEVVSLLDEASVIEYDPTRQQPTDLPGRGPGSYSPIPVASDPPAVSANTATNTADTATNGAGDETADQEDAGYVLNWGGGS